MTAALRFIPVVDARSGGPLATAPAAAVQMSDLLATARLIYSPPLLEAMDWVSRRWLERSGNPFCAELHGIATLLMSNIRVLARTPPLAARRSSGRPRGRSRTSGPSVALSGRMPFSKRSP